MSCISFRYIHCVLLCGICSKERLKTDLPSTSFILWWHKLSWTHLKTLYIRMAWCRTQVLPSWSLTRGMVHPGRRWDLRTTGQGCVLILGCTLQTSILVSTPLFGAFYSFKLSFIPGNKFPSHSNLSWLHFSSQPLLLPQITGLLSVSSTEM